MSVVSLMNWKSSTLATGAALLAGYFVTGPSSNLPGSLMPAQPRDVRSVPAAPSDIEEQATKLQARLREEALYRQPARNLFRFAERAPARPAPRVEPPPAIDVPVTPPAPLPLPIRLVGVAIDGDVRTAILSTPTGVILAKAGEDALGFRVSGIADESVTLVNPVSGASLTLTLNK
jgi:hypothetical protein